LGWPWYTGWTFSTMGITISPKDHFDFIEKFFGTWPNGGALQDAINAAGTGYINGQPFLNSFATGIDLYGDPALPFYK